MTEVQPITKEDQCHPGERVPCVCGCGKVAVLKKKPNKDGTYHVRGCAPCWSCQGLRNRTKGRQSQAKARRRIGIPSSAVRGRGTHEEDYRDPRYRWEHKHDGVNAKPVVGAFRRMEKQANASKAIGDVRPFAASVEWDGEILVIERARDYRQSREEAS